MGKSNPLGFCNRGSPGNRGSLRVRPGIEVRSGNRSSPGNKGSPPEVTQRRVLMPATGTDADDGY